MRLLLLFVSCVMLLCPCFLQHSSVKLMADIDDEVDINDLNSDKRYYELVNKRFKPEQDEFYLDAIYSVGETSWVNISRSKEIRASDLHRTGISYAVGSPLNDYLVIEAIKPEKKSVILRDIRTGKAFQLRMTYGSAKSHLIPLVDKD